MGRLSAILFLSALFAGASAFGQTVDIDVRPYLIERPNVPFPETQLRNGVTSAKVVLEVLIDSKGKLTVLRVAESPHEDFTQMALRFASSARFTPALKKGSPVDAEFKWPLILRSH